MKIKKLISSLICCLIVSGMVVGCNRGIEKQVEQTSGDNRAVDKEKIEEDDKENATEVNNAKKTYSYWVPIASNAASIMKNLGESHVYQELEKKTGVHIEFLHPPQGGEKEQFSLIINSGDYPDMISQPSPYAGGSDKAIEEGVYLRLNELIDEYAPNYKALRDSNPEIARQTITDEGNIWSMACIQAEIEPPWAGPAIRMDWLEELGIEEPNTIPEWENMLKAFRDEKGAEAPMTWTSVGIEWTGNIIGAFGIGPSYYRTAEEEVKFGPIQPEFKEYLMLLNRWYKEGLIDKDFVTRDSKSIEELVTNGKTGVIGTAYGGLDFYHDIMRESEPGFTLQGIVYPKLTEDSPRVGFRQSNTYNKGNDTVVTTACKDPEGAVAWLDYAYGEEGYYLFNYGIENLTYELIDGQPQFTEFMINNPDKNYSMMVWDYKLHLGPYLRKWDARPPLSEEVINSIDKWSEAEDFMNLPVLSLTSEESKTYSKVSTDINVYVEEMTVKFIIGVEPIERFDEYVENIRKLGVEKAININQTALNRYNNR